MKVNEAGRKILKEWLGAVKKGMKAKSKNVFRTPKGRGSTLHTILTFVSHWWLSMTGFERAYLAVSTFGMLATVLVLAVYLFQLDNMSGQLEVARMSADASAKSAKAAEDSIAQARAIQSARLVIEDFAPTITPDKANDGLLIRGTYKIRNVGGTVAREIFANRSSGGGVQPPQPMPKILPSPSPTGPSLAAGERLEYPVGWQVGNDVMTGKMYFSVNIWISYRDIFDEGKIVHACFQYYPARKMFIPCPGETPGLRIGEPDPTAK